MTLIASHAPTDNAGRADAHLDAQRLDSQAVQLKTLLDSAPRCFESIASAVSEFNALAAEAATAAREPIRRIETACRKAEALERRVSQAADHAANLEARLESVLLRTSSEAESLDRKLEGFEQRLAALESAACARIESAAGARLDHAESSIGRLHDDAVTSVRTASQSLKAEIETAQSLAAGAVAQVEAACRTSETAGRRVAGEVVNAVRSSEEAITRQKQDLTSTLKLAREITEGMAKSAETAVQKLSDKAAETVRLSEEAVARHACEISNVSREARGVVDDLTEGIETARRRTHQLSSAVEAGGKLIDQKLAQASERATGILASLETERDSAAATVKECRIQAEGARSLIEAARTEVPRLECSLQAVVEAGASLKASAEEAQAEHENAAGILTLLREEVEHASTLIQNSQRDGTRLKAIAAEAAATGASTLTMMRDAAKTLRRRQDEWAAALESVGRRADELTSASHSATALAGDVEARMRALATEMDRSAQLHQRQALEVEESAQRHQARLAQGRESDAHLAARIEDGRSLAGEISAAAQRFDHTIAGLTAQCVEAGDAARRVAEIAADLRKRHDELTADGQKLNELRRQIVPLESRLEQLDVSSESLRIQLNSLLAAPQSATRDAAKQSLQLEETCRTSRKVLAVLSGAALEAAKRIEEIKRLHDGVGQAGNLLREWVREAVHVHGRLAHTLEHTPAIGQTHPVGRLNRLAELAEPLSPPPTTEAAVGKRQEPGTAVGRATAPRLVPEEVARLIREAEARRAAESAAVLST